ncbi:sulfite reductase flavoprotein subunit alpha [Variovorax arabinosiphilus]|uniref:sulfite reductase flavoprotein subunit alpha n=1 Tax=Variovorax arabinosiphilus TaxID=3053498 RepID=UPI0025777B6E|nr:MULTISPECIES: sulfite reductase flavoprotein subunit alpha [unclassified Variovorax]MDM0118471.1 sulfite reductase flavoprotein subunit alpha [Variovorax sp. J2L1-78]MDM0128896.1 sulfite reductase flavoprotein subunit alpha [Variovorax sp. J2L1-63]MDM0233318.1 sulfite reductase flavoprotein subunit alpha [Variovorax sp. J2R1-6]
MGSLRRVWFQIHWFIGITAGTVLVVIGVTGAALSFRAEIVEAINPGLRHVAPPPGARLLTPAELMDRVQAHSPGHRVANIRVFSEPGRPARIGFAPAPGERRGEARLVDPYTAALLPEPQGEDFFEFMERLHRWLLLPRDTGKSVTGTLAAGLLVLSLSGLYLRWPRRPLAWRAWLRLDFGLTGRAFLWNLHAVVGTVALVVYLVSSLTGVYWGFDTVRTWVDDAAGEGRTMRAQRAQGGGAKAASPPAPVKLDLPRVWQSFGDVTQGDWSQVTLQLPARNASNVEATYLRAVPEHERARNRLYLNAATGEPSQHERYADKPLAGRLVNSIYPMHMGTYWGLPGRIVMTASSLAMALFAITGWMLYLGRRRTKKAVRAERARLGEGAPASGGEAVLIAFATQTGQAEGLALQTAGALQSAGIAAVVKPVSELTADVLAHFKKALWIVSTFGEGDPPDTARAFARGFARLGPDLRHLQYGVLALGDRRYAAFCGFGRKLDHDLRTQSAQALFPMVEVDANDGAALGTWRAALARVFGLGGDAASSWSTADTAARAPAFEPWYLKGRRLLNPGSEGDPLYEIELSGPSAATWAPGALVEVLPPAPPAAGDAPVAPRSYSVASLPSDGALQLLVRQARHANGLGVASGWLTEGAALGDEVPLRLVANPSFTLVDDAQPCIFIGNGSGFAGLRAHLRERVRRGHGRNWLVYGERASRHDAFFVDELSDWRARGLLARADIAYSRDQPERIYVQDKLRAAADELAAWVNGGAVVYVCGSLAGMAPGVDAAFADILGVAAFDELIARGRYRRDVY